MAETIIANLTISPVAVTANLSTTPVMVSAPLSVVAGPAGDSHVPDPSAATDGAMLTVASGALVLATTLDSPNLILDGGIIE